ncbi:unnamed protein product [Effrenium voratum]|uniref:Uncharacterized protein n=1 Tax=Effrenium voratum TaxID=2562239 RepID=A0AA36NM06_9DINO|nr:unnamed protein product [Effrenium voratum]CAJ1410256.1 unnamed protein product [Effrenium voratum]CAJ1445340.1 unnamed protein product [Effrenium voratum]|eukprot:CAMPEP_0181435604 /NCGR_PEP_ID=MMETSP1110-20121109/20418_1 /TAXON_ID=174948 /ORGANISM="Symbiodinium sp., Strain CCMP421" /LENGTH=168 /DNA_ID=CAMNT_0023559143 /DNA_START=57 /DNA_END=563 /DNA_ORIENTATION=+
MAVVAVRRPSDFPEADLNRQLCMASSRRTRRPRQVPADWTVCEYEAEKDWVLCDRVDAIAAEMSEHLRLNSKVEDLPTSTKGADYMEVDPSTKEATMRFAEMLEECLEDCTPANKDRPRQSSKEPVKREMTRAARKAAWRATQKEEEKQGLDQDIEDWKTHKARRNRN